MLALFGLNILLEVHHPGSSFNRVIYLFLSRMQNVSFAPISKQLNNYLVSRYKIKNSRIIEWPSTTNVAEYQKFKKYKVRELLGFSDEKFVVVHTGSAYIGRGVEFYKNICIANPNILFVHIGGDKKDIERLNQDAEENGITNASFLESCPRSKVILYQKAADCLFYVITKDWPTYWCCSPLKIPEYLSCGSPILAPSIGSIPEILGDCYMEYDLENPKSITTALRTLIDNQQLKDSLSSKSLSKALECYDHGVKIERLIEKLLN